jgi:ABC-type nickel/cobalt efflux system permease component RcnA
LIAIQQRWGVVKTMMRKIQKIQLLLTVRRVGIILLAILAFGFGGMGNASAHPLGNFTVNHFARLEIGPERVDIHYVVDMAEIPTFQTLQTLGTNGQESPAETTLHHYLQQVVAAYADGLHLTVDHQSVPLKSTPKVVTLPPGIGGLLTLRVEAGFTGLLPNSGNTGIHSLRFDDANHLNRIGWHEIVVVPRHGINIFNSSVFGSAVTDELRAYPADLLTTPLNERAAELSFTRGAVPAHATTLLTRDRYPAVPSRDRLAELITVPDITPTVLLLSLLMAAALGSAHAFSPGHGKTMVGAYLIGSRATALHAGFLGLTVTITHTMGVFALGLVTLLASQYILPERLFPVLSLVAGATVVILGLSLLIGRLRILSNPHNSYHHEHSHVHHHGHIHGHSHPGLHLPDHPHTNEAELTAISHSHSGHPHTHLPPGADGSDVTWKSLLALGISGGLLPCPSALVVFLSAVSLHRVGFGLLLVLAFSVGLASTLTVIGVAFIYARRIVRQWEVSGRLTAQLSVLSALAISCIGACMCYGAFKVAF